MLGIWDCNACVQDLLACHKDAQEEQGKLCMVVTNNLGFMVNVFRCEGGGGMVMMLPMLLAVV